MTRAQAAQRAAMGKHGQPIVMPTANGTAPTKNGAATKASLTEKRSKKAQSRSITANNKTAKSSLQR